MKIKLTGGQKLTGTIKMSGAKNSVLALLPATILTDEVVSFESVPNISDVDLCLGILNSLNTKTTYVDELCTLDSKDISYIPLLAPEVSEYRASYYFMGPMLAKFKKVEIAIPGGCNFGGRPIDLHIKGFEALGAVATQSASSITLSCEKLVGAEIYLDFASVGATMNIMLAAVLAEGKTVIDNAAKEPEIIDLAILLTNMGAKIRGAGTSEIRIEGVKKLHGTFHTVIPDRIQAGTYLIAGALMGDNLVIENVIPEHIHPLIQKMTEMGVDFIIEDDKITISQTASLKGVDIQTNIHPGFPTDLQQPFTVLLTQATNNSQVKENIFQKRFGHIEGLKGMGANIHTDENICFVKGPTPLYGNEVEASDLRGGICLLLAGLIAHGDTVILKSERILRGYDQIIEKLTNVGAIIEIIE